MTNEAEEELYEHEPIDDALDVDRHMARLDRRTLRVARKLNRVEDELARAESQVEEEVSHITDAVFFRAIVQGAFVGISAVFVLVTAMAMAAGFVPITAMFVAILPAVFVGPYVGGFAMLSYRCAVAEAPDHRVHWFHRHAHGTRMRTA